MESVLSNRLNKSYNSTLINELFDSSCVLGTTIGSIRKQNEDRGVICRIKNNNINKYFYCYIISDGMGGMVSGELAASLTVSVFIRSMHMLVNEGKSFKEAIKKSVLDANETVYNELKSKGGATLSVIVIDHNLFCYMCNVGDSRVYSVSDLKIKKLTEDDNVKNALDKLGNFKVNEELLKKNGLTKFIGIGEELDFDVTKIDSSDRFLLCTDGAYNVGMETLEKLNKYSSTPLLFTQRLIHQSIWFGGLDNATVILVDFSNINETFFNPSNDSSSLEIWDFHGFYSVQIDTIIITKEAIDEIDKKTISKPSSRRKKQRPKNNKSENKTESNPESSEISQDENGQLQIDINPTK